MLARPVPLLYNGIGCKGNENSMTTKTKHPAVRVLPEDVANKIAAGEVVERPASVVKELVENALDAKATRVIVRLVAAGRRTIEVVDNGHGMSEQDALLGIERHATSKIRKAADLDSIDTLGFRGEALPSIASVSRFELVTRRAQDEHATRIRVEGGVLRDVSQAAAPVGTRITANRLYFNTPVRAKFLKGITTELSHSIDTVQRHALACPGVGFQLLHNEKLLFDVPEHTSLRDRVALIWGLSFAKELVELEGEGAGLTFSGLIGTPALSRSQRSHQFFFLNSRPVVNRSLQYGYEDGYRGLLTIGRRPVGIVMVQSPPRLVDINIHPSKREIRFRDERAAREAMRNAVRERLARIAEADHAAAPVPTGLSRPWEAVKAEERSAPPISVDLGAEESQAEAIAASDDAASIEEPESTQPSPTVQTDFVDPKREGEADVAPEAFYEPVGHLADAPLQVFDTYLLVPEDDRLLIIDQHALHERLTFDSLVADLRENDYEAQQLAVPLLIDVPPSYTKVLEANLDLFVQLGMEIEPFGGNTFQVTSVCHLYDEAKVPDAVCRVLDTLAQGDLFNKEDFVADLLRLAVEACRSSVKGGDELAPEERRQLLEGFRRLRPPYTCPHGRPIITELTQTQMEKSFRRRQ